MVKFTSFDSFAKLARYYYIIYCFAMTTQILYQSNIIILVIAAHIQNSEDRISVATTCGPHRQSCYRHV